MVQSRSGLLPLLAIAAATLATLAGCSKSPSPEHKSEAPTPAVNVAWTKFVDEFIEAYFAAQPPFAVASGLVWLAASAAWAFALRRSVARTTTRLVVAAVFGLATTALVWLLLMAVFAGRTND